MSVYDLLKKEGFSVSFEVFPPKSDTAFEKVKEATEKIASLKPGFISVTYGAGGGTSRYTLDIAKNIKEKYGVPTLAHLTCVSSDRDTVKQRIEDIHEAGIENVMALRGDLTPELMGADRDSLDYKYAIQLVEELKKSPYEFCIGGACYPEVHPESENSVTDINHLLEKVKAGCDFLTTQMFFDNSLFYSFLYRIREAGINCPVVPGIMPITSAKQVKRSIELSGSFMPQRFLSLVDRFGGKEEAMKQAGIIYATDQIIDLFANGIKHVHVYTMNNPDVAEKILNNLKGITD